MFILLTPVGAKSDEPLLVAIEHLAAVIPAADGKASVLVAGRELAVEESVKDVIQAVEDLMESLDEELDEGYDDEDYEGEDFEDEDDDG
ncbi:MAG: hypothetical protein H6721_07345 [Sandaracinus sp.]|jgi:hypothetical protein|nr:hypothetical protein [Myxococcales bacterium]MCB9603029.1 hypothetical protein [Sandaracinus sp.]MCB9612693.1 hypothetical protein [Sandaracinus sp.]MCB9620035.1 hypothetical protein [Sandaracinus sp.]MCB9631935.1 hypothetical protein [Sandaracinus sp.]